MIVVFGAAVRADGEPTLTLRRRVVAALAFAATCRPAPMFLLSGAVGRHPPSEAAVMARLLREHGVPAERMILDDRSRDTLDTVLATRAILRSRHHRGPVWAATSAYHLPRCLLLLRLAGLAALAVPPPPFPASRALLRRWRWRLREIPAIPFDAALLLLDRIGLRRASTAD